MDQRRQKLKKGFNFQVPITDINIALDCMDQNPMMFTQLCKYNDKDKYKNTNTFIQIQLINTKTNTKVQILFVYILTDLIWSASATLVRRTSPRWHTSPTGNASTSFLSVLILSSSSLCPLNKSGLPVKRPRVPLNFQHNNHNNQDLQTQLYQYDYHTTNQSYHSKSSFLHYHQHQNIKIRKNIEN